MKPYRFGFNGKEKDDKGEWGQTAYDYGFRIYNPGIAKFLSVDPLADNFPYWSPYAFAGNTPLQAVDLDGLEILGYKTMYELSVRKSKLADQYYIKTVSGKSLMIHNNRVTSHYGQGFFHDTYAGVVWCDTKGGALKFENALFGNTNYTEYVFDDPIQRSVDEWMNIDYSKSLMGKPSKYNEEARNYHIGKRFNNQNSKGGAIASGLKWLIKKAYEHSPDYIARLNTKDMLNQKRAYFIAFEAISFAFTDSENNDLWEKQTEGVDSQSFRMEVVQYIVDGYISKGNENENKIKEFGEFVKHKVKIASKGEIDLDKRLKRNADD